LKKQFNSRRAQSSIEFVILVTFVLIIFTFVSFFIQSRTLEASEVKNRNYANQLKNIVFNEIDIADLMPVNYSREFSLPVYLDGSDYDIKLYNGIELIIGYRQQEYVYFFERDFTLDSSLHQGINLIQKTRIANVITYNFSEI